MSSGPRRPTAATVGREDEDGLGVDRALIGLDLLGRMRVADAGLGFLRDGLASCATSRRPVRRAGSAAVRFRDSASREWT
jgi:hypothetical protein